MHLYLNAVIQLILVSGVYSPRFHRGGVCLKHLRSLPRAKQRKESTSNPLHLRMALSNTRGALPKSNYGRKIRQYQWRLVNRGRCKLAPFNMLTIS